MDRSLAPMRPSRALQETSHIVFVTSPRNLSRGRGTIDNVDVSLHLFSCTRQARYRDTDSEIACTSFLSFLLSLFFLRIMITASRSVILFSHLSIYVVILLISIKLRFPVASLTCFTLTQCIVLLFLISFIHIY